MDSYNKQAEAQHKRGLVVHVDELCVSGFAEQNDFAKMLFA